MKRIVSLLSLLCLFVLSAWDSVPPELRTVNQSAFQRGEKLKYRVHYGLITAGTATLEVLSAPKVVKGHNCYHVVGIGQSVPSFDYLYKIRDKYESMIDETSLVPWQFIEDVKEGDYKRHTEARFDHYNNTAIHIDNSFRASTHNTVPYVQDIMSAFYFARTTDHTKLVVGSRINLTNFFDKKTYKLYAELLKREVITVDGKKYKALKMKLCVDEAGMITDGGKIQFWISDDMNKLPLRIESELTVGSIKADLVEYSGLKNPFSSKLN